MQTADWKTAVLTNDKSIEIIDGIGKKFISLEYELYNYRRNRELSTAGEANKVQVLMMFLQFGFLIGISLIISRDITARTKAEKSLMESEEKFRSISQSTADAIITADSKGTIIGWNRGAEKIFGYSEDEIRGEKLIKIIPQKFIERRINQPHPHHGQKHRQRRAEQG